MLTCETYGDAIAYAVDHQVAAGAMLDHLVDIRGREVCIDVSPRLFDLQIEAFLVDEAMASLVGISRCVVGVDFKPLGVDLSRPRPENEEPYRRFFRCPVRFNAGRDRLTFDSDWLNVRLAGYDRITCKLVQTQLNTLLKRPVGRLDLVESVVNRIRFDMGARATQGELANLVNISDRTMRRRLSRQSISYTQLRDATRFERARDLLANSAMTVAQVAELVGYSDARAFRRAFKRWTGILPAAFRERQG